MEIKLLVLDIDGTIKTSQNTITQATKTAIAQAQSRGVVVALASGRPTHGMISVAEELNLRESGGYLLSYNGAKITRLCDNETIFQQTLPPTIIPTLRQKALDAGAQISTYIGESVVSEDTQNPFIQHEINLLGMQPMQVTDLVETVAQNPVKKCLIVGEPTKIIPLGEALNREFPTTLNAFRSEDFFLEVVPVGVDKANSIAHLCTHLKITQNQTMAMGDGHNDLTMIQWAGTGVAMANAKDEVKKSANHITLSNDQDGAALAIQKFILQN